MSAQPDPTAAPLARGNTSDIWAWSGHAVVKVLHPGIPGHWAEMEADTLARVRSAGLPVPECEGIVEFDGRAGIVMERIEGVSMWERIKREPNRVASLIEQLVDLQIDVQRTFVPGLVPMVRRLHSKIGDATQLSAAERDEAKEVLKRLPDGDALCHGDFHPANIILADRGPVILDWFDAAAGDVTADFVRSSLLMRPPFDRSSWLAGSTPELLDQIHSHYITELVRRGSLDAQAFGSWEVVTAVARMCEPVPDMDLIAIWERWKRHEPTGVRSLIEHCQELVGAGDGAC
ncbi:MAG: phosphotransferase [Candidatus Limnocylindrales bacterium]